jgi:hypothetical protein
MRIWAIVLLALDLALCGVLSTRTAIAIANRNRVEVSDKVAGNTTGFSLALRIKDNRVKRNQHVLVEFLIQNLTKRFLGLEETSPENEYEILVRNSQGQKVSPTERGRLVRSNKGQDFRVIGIKVKPGEQRSDMMDIARLYDLSAPGVYRVRATRSVKRLNSKLNYDTWIEVKSNTLTVTIVP